MTRHKHGTPIPHAPPSEDRRGAPAQGRLLRLGALPRRAPTAFELVPDADALAAMRDRLGLTGLRKLRLAGRIVPAGARDWTLEARLGATVQQPCSVTLDPVTTRIDEPVTRRYLADVAPAPEGESEMPEDDDAEPLPDRVDLAALAEEALALALPAFPRAPGVAPVEVTATPPGAAPIAEETRANPFAALAGLKPRPNE